MKKEELRELGIVLKEKKDNHLSKVITNVEPMLVFYDTLSVMNTFSDEAKEDIEEAIKLLKYFSETTDVEVKTVKREDSQIENHLLWEDIYK